MVGTLGVLTLIGIALAVRGRRGGLPLAVAARVLSAVSSIPAFFAYVPDGVIAIVAVGMVLTALGVVLVAPRLDRRSVTA